FRHYPFTIILKEEVSQLEIQPLRLKIDPGSKTTGLAIVNDATGEVVWAAELTHRGTAIKARLDARRALRRNRRARKTRHRAPRSRHGSDRVSNLCIACAPCNQAKGNRTAAEFGHPQVQAKAKMPLKDAAAVNATRWALFRRLSGRTLPLEVGTGGRTKFNRTT